MHCFRINYPGVTTAPSDRKGSYLFFLTYFETKGLAKGLKFFNYRSIIKWFTLLTSKSKESISFNYFRRGSSLIYPRSFILPHCSYLFLVVIFFALILSIYLFSPISTYVIIYFCELSNLFRGTCSSFLNSFPNMSRFKPIDRAPIAASFIISWDDFSSIIDSDGIDGIYRFIYLIIS